jgi:hypothetical protein
VQVNYISLIGCAADTIRASKCRTRENSQTHSSHMYSIVRAWCCPSRTMRVRYEEVDGKNAGRAMVEGLRVVSYLDSLSSHLPLSATICGVFHQFTVDRSYLLLPGQAPSWAARDEQGVAFVRTLQTKIVSECNQIFSLHLTGSSLCRIPQFRMQGIRLIVWPTLLRCTLLATLSRAEPLNT